MFLNSTDRQWQTKVLFDLLPLTRDWDIIVASRRQKHYGAGAARGVMGVQCRAQDRVRCADERRRRGQAVRREIITRFELVSRSPFNEAERLIRAARAGYRITAVATDTLPRQRGRARGLSRHLLFSAIADVGRVWWSLHAGRGTTRAGSSNPDRPVAVPGKRPAESSHADRR